MKIFSLLFFCGLMFASLLVAMDGDSVLFKNAETDDAFSPEQKDRIKIDSVRTWLLVLQKMPRNDIVELLRNGDIKSLSEYDRQMVEGFGLVKDNEVNPLVYECLPK